MELIETKTRLIESQHNHGETKNLLQVSLKETKIVRASLSEAERNAINLKQSVEKLKQDRSESNNSNTIARKRIDDLESSILQLRTRISYIDAERQKLRSDRDQTHFDLKKIEFENKSYKDDLVKKDADSEEMSKSFKKMLQSKMSEVASLYEEIMEKDAAITSLNAQLRDINEKFTALKSKFDKTLSHRSNTLISTSAAPETMKDTIQTVAPMDDTKSSNALAKQRSGDFREDVTRIFDNVEDHGTISSAPYSDEITVRKSTPSKDSQDTILPKKDFLFDRKFLSKVKARKPSNANKKRKNRQKNDLVNQHENPMKISSQLIYRKNIELKIAPEIQSCVNLMTIETLERTFVAVKNTKIHSTKELRSILYAIVHCAILNEEKSHLCVALLEKLFARTVVTHWQQSFIRTGVIDSKYYWQDGSDGLKLGPFSDSLEALQHAVRETNPKVLLHQICLMELSVFMLMEAVLKVL